MEQFQGSTKWKVLNGKCWLPPSWLGVLLLQVRTAWEPLLQNLSVLLEKKREWVNILIYHTFPSAALLVEGPYAFLHFAVVSASVEERKEKKCV